MLHRIQNVYPNKKSRLLDQVRYAIRARHYSIRTEEAYVQWIRRYILFHDKRHLLFPASNRSVDPRTGIERRHHLDKTLCNS